MDLDAFILIGGRSKRFGRDKAFVEFEGETLAARAARLVLEAFPAGPVRFVAASKDQFGNRVNELELPVVFDRHAGFGGWSALDAALSMSDAEWTFVLACDLPLVTRELLRRLWASATESVNAVVPRQVNGRLQPLCALYRNEAVARVVEEIMAASERLPPLATIFDRIPTAVVDADEPLLRNVNTLSDLS